MADLPNVTILSTIKSWFNIDSKPTATQFWAVFDSFWHKNETIPIDRISNLNETIANKTDNEVFLNHLNNTNAHQERFADKVDKIDGKGLSTNDFTDEIKTKISSIANSEAITLQLGAGITANVDFVGDNLKGEITLDIQSIDATVLNALSEVELCKLNFNNSLLVKPFIQLTPSNKILNIYAKTDLDAVRFFTDNYDVSSGELFQSSVFPFTVSFFYNITY